jgi:hypothetical protein
MLFNKKQFRFKGYAFLLIATIISSCASKNYSSSEREKNNSFTISSNVSDATIKIKSPLFRKKESFNNTLKNSNGKYYSKNTFKKLKFGRTILIVSKENYDSEKIKIWRLPRFKALGRDLLLSTITFGLPIVVDVFRSDFYKIAGWSKNINVELKFSQEFMKKKYLEIENSKLPEPFIAYINDYSHSLFIEQAKDKRDSTELLVALDKSSESALEDYISTHKNSKFKKEATEIQSGIIEAREKFEFTKKINSVEAYEEYLTKYSKSLQKKEAINRLVDVALKNVVSQNKLETLLSYNKDYLLKYQLNLNADTVNSKTDRLTKLIDKQIIKENDTDPKNKYLSYSKVWKKYAEVSGDNKNLIGLQQCEAYLPKISNILLSEIAKLMDEAKQNSYLKKAENDFPMFVNRVESETPVPFVNIIIDNAIGYNGFIKLYNLKFVENRLIESSEREALKSIVGFEYKGEYFSNYKDATIEEVTLKNGQISSIKLYNGKNLLLTGNYNGNISSECSFYLNGKLVKSDYSDKNGFYSYEFENGVNLSLKNLENKIKEADAEVTSKNFDKAIEMYTTSCSNDFPKSIPLNMRIEKSIQNAKNQKAAYLQKLEEQRVAEAKRQEQLRIVEEKKRALEEEKLKKQYEQNVCIIGKFVNDIDMAKSMNVYSGQLYDKLSGKYEFHEFYSNGTLKYGTCKQWGRDLKYSGYGTYNIDFNNRLLTLYIDGDVEKYSIERTGVDTDEKCLRIYKINSHYKNESYSNIN